MLEALIGLIILIFILVEIWGTGVLVGLAAIVVFIIVAAASDKSYDTRVQEVMQNEAGNAQFLYEYLDALKILNRVLKALNRGEVLLSIISPSVEPSTLVWFNIKSVIYDDDGWLKDNLFTVDVEDSIRFCKKMEEKGLNPIPVPEWEQFYKTGTVWSGLTDDEFLAIKKRIKHGAKCTIDELGDTSLEQTLTYHCQENEKNVYLSAIAQAIREKYPHYNVEMQTMSIFVKQ